MSSFSYGRVLVAIIKSGKISGELKFKYSIFPFMFSIVFRASFTAFCQKIESAMTHWILTLSGLFETGEVLSSFYGDRSTSKDYNAGNEEEQNFKWVPIDRLSDLPDCLIHHILSLIDIKSAVQTCILSQRWNNFWTSLPKLNFDSQSFNKLTPFKKFVLNVLSRCKAHGLFSLREVWCLLWNHIP